MYIVALIIVAVVMLVLSLGVTRGTPSLQSDFTNGTRFFLVVLRLAIGWQLLVEGVDKVTDPDWSSEAYLRGSQGPAAPFFQNLAGDTLRDRLEVGADKTFPPALAADWQKYLDRFQSHYQLDPVKPGKQPAVKDKKEKDKLDLKQPVTKVDKEDEVATDKIPDPKKVEDEASKPKAPAVASKEIGTPSQKDHAEVILKQHKAQTLNWLTEGMVVVEKKPPKGDPMPVAKTTQDWLKELDEINKRTAAAEASPTWTADGDDVKAWERQIRAALKRGLDERTATLKADLQNLLTPEQEDLGDLPAPGYFRLPSGTLLQWSDFMVKWGLTIGGVCLIGGLFTRTAAVVGALLLINFYLAMPALPWLPANPRAEGHYLFINKTLIEAIALLAIATTRSGRWFGFDGLVQFLFPSRWRPVRQK